jgi:shikimate kinase
VPDGKWTKVSDLGGTYSGLYSGGDGPAFVSLTADGEPAMMALTGVSQIYSLQWKH